MAADTAEMAAAIRRSLATIYNMSDEQLAQRDTRIKAHFHGVSRGGSFTRAGAANFEQLAILILGHPLD